MKQPCDKYKNLLFKKRFDIEGFFGNVKNKFFCFVNASTQEVGKTLVYAKFLARLLVVFLFYIFHLKKFILFSVFYITHFKIKQFFTNFSKIK